jgi:hypothetical protein
VVGAARGGSKIFLVLADADGTLVTAEKVLTPRAAAAVKALRTAGIAFAITSGRPPRRMSMLIEPMALQKPRKVSSCWVIRSSSNSQFLENNPMQSSFWVRFMCPKIRRNWLRLPIVRFHPGSSCPQQPP